MVYVNANAERHALKGAIFRADERKFVILYSLRSGYFFGNLYRSFGRDLHLFSNTVSSGITCMRHRSLLPTFHGVVGCRIAIADILWYSPLQSAAVTRHYVVKEQRSWGQFCQDVSAEPLHAAVTISTCYLVVLSFATCRRRYNSLLRSSTFVYSSRLRLATTLNG